MNLYDESMGVWEYGVELEKHCQLQLTINNYKEP